jgi:guanine deaminase
MSVFGAIRSPILNPRPDGSVEFWSDGVLIWDQNGKLLAAGKFTDVAPKFALDTRQCTAARGIVIPPMLDAHIHIPQHPIRGKFLEGVEGNPPGGPLLAGLNRNVFPTEGKCSDESYTADVVQIFAKDTLRHGVIGGAAYMTVHAPATRTALSALPREWNVGLVLMERACPEYLRTDQPNLLRDTTSLAADFGRRVIVTDRFAGAVDTPLRKQGVALAQQLGLRTQTHLNEQIAEKAWIEGLYPNAKSYTDVYRHDGLLQQQAILAHCIRMAEEEFDMLAAVKGCAIAHCPVSNTLLGSGVMPLDTVHERGIPFAICTDVGASPTTSMLTEITQFLRVHRTRSKYATPATALFGITLAPAQILGQADRIGTFEVGKEASFVEVGRADQSYASADEAILSGLLLTSEGELDAYLPGGERGKLVDQLVATGLGVGKELAVLTQDVQQVATRLDQQVQRVTLRGKTIWSR